MFVIDRKLAPFGKLHLIRPLVSCEMMKIIYSIIGAVFGALFLAACIKIDSALGISPHFPAYAGEEDFQLRAVWFVALVLPGFMLIGGWLGVLVRENAKMIFFGIGGMLSGALIFFLLVYCLTSILESLPNREAVNASVIALYVLWLICSFLGVWGANKVSKRKKETVQNSVSG